MTAIDDGSHWVEVSTMRTSTELTRCPQSNRSRRSPVIYGGAVDFHEDKEA